MLSGLPLHHKFHSELVVTVSHHATHWWVEVLRFLFMQISELVRMLTHRCFSVCRCTINFTRNLLEQCLITRHTDELRFWGFWFTQISELVRMLTQFQIVLTHRCFPVCRCTINFTRNLLEQCLITRHTDELRFWGFGLHKFQNLWECFNTSMLFGLPLHHKFHSELVGTVSHHATHWWVEVLRFWFTQISELVRMF